MLAAHQSAWPGYIGQSLVCRFDTRWRQFQKFQLKSPFTVTWARKKKQRRKGNNRWVFQQRLPKIGGQAASPWFLPPKIINECVCARRLVMEEQSVSQIRGRRCSKEKGRPVKLCGFDIIGSLSLNEAREGELVVCPQIRACLAAIMKRSTLFKSPTQLSHSPLWPRFPPRCLLC